MSDDLSQFSMMELFRMEAETHAAVLTEGLLELEKDPAATERTEELMRAAHSLKGAARIVGLDPAVKLAHAMEDGFVAVQEGKLRFRADHVDLLLQAVDQLKALSSIPESEIEPTLAAQTETIAALAQSIQSLCHPDSVAAEPPPAPAPEIPSQGQAAGATASEPTAATESQEREPQPAVEVETPSAKDSPPPSPTATPASAQVVRVGSENLSRLMELAAQSMVESRRLESINRALQALRSHQVTMENALTELQEVGTDETARTPLVPVLGTLSTTLEVTHSILERLTDLDDYQRRSTDVSGRLYHEVLASRMRPFAEGTTQYPRLVRDLSRQLGKQVDWTLEGKTTPVDRDILERLDAPLNHMIRNALDHGIEMPEERRRAGKPETGRLQLRAFHHDGMLNITLTDDGRGIEIERLRAKIVEKGLTSAEIARGMRPHELLDFLFLPAFSTAPQVTEVSGRGVGLDVVQTLMQALGGKVHITTQPDQGTTFHLQLPISRSVVRTLLVRIAGEPYAVPLSRVDRAVRLPAEEKRFAEGRQFLSLDDQNVGVVGAWQVLGFEADQSANDECSVLVFRDRQGQPYGLEVDRFLDEQDLVVRPLDPRLGKVPDLSACAVGDDGMPLLILDVDDMIRSIDSLLTGGRLARIVSAPTAVIVAGTKKAKRVLVVDDSITVRELQRQLLQSHGYAVDTAVDGMEGWNAVRLEPYDLVVSDVDMPRMTGIELITRIRAEDRFRDLPVIIVSYKDREEDRRRGLEVGANDYLTKSSFMDETFLQTVVDLIGDPSE